MQNSVNLNNSKPRTTQKAQQESNTLS